MYSKLIDFCKSFVEFCFLSVLRKINPDYTEKFDSVAEDSSYLQDNLDSYFKQWYSLDKRDLLLNYLEGIQKEIPLVVCKLVEYDTRTIVYFSCPITSFLWSITKEFGEEQI